MGIVAAIPERQLLRAMKRVPSCHESVLPESGGSLRMGVQLAIYLMDGTREYIGKNAMSGMWLRI